MQIEHIKDLWYICVRRKYLGKKQLNVLTRNLTDRKK